MVRRLRRGTPGLRLLGIGAGVSLAPIPGGGAREQVGAAPLRLDLLLRREPRKTPATLVNGRLAIEDGRPTLTLAGKGLRRPVHPEWKCLA